MPADFTAGLLEAVRKNSSFGRLCNGTRGLRFPHLAQRLSLREHIGFRFVEAWEHPCALDRVAGSAASDQVFRTLLTFPRARNHKVHAHGQGVVETRSAIQAAILTAVVIPLQDLAAFFNRYRSIHQGESREA